MSEPGWGEGLWDRGARRGLRLLARRQEGLGLRLRVAGGVPVAAAEGVSGLLGPGRGTSAAGR